MGTITGYGQIHLSSNTALCNIRTNNSGGYKLDWQSSSATMTTGSPNYDTINFLHPSRHHPGTMDHQQPLTLNGEPASHDYLHHQ